MTTQQDEWRAQIESHARMLEWQAAIARLLAMAETPRDAIDAAGDLVRGQLHIEALRRARAGERVPDPPAPVSKLLTGFADTLRAKLLAVSTELLPAERESLRRLAPRVLDAIEQQDEDIVTVLAQLLPLAPDLIAWWIRAHLDIIQRRFAS